MSLATLPGELYMAIVRQLDPSSWTQVVLSLSRALPSAPIPIHLLFHSIRIRCPPQAVSLYLRLRKESGTTPASNAPPGELCASWVKEFSVETWTADAVVIINVIRLLPNIQSLNLRIGPNNFSPEHLEGLFTNPIAYLKELSLRFRPYVEKASYYQFHKGVYFDSTLLALAKWPPQKLPIISIVQDPHDTRTTTCQRRSFAQPIVFFLLDPHLSVLLHSPAIAYSLKALRLRIPSRPVARALCMSPGQTEAYHNPDALPVVPNLEFLDLTTCGVIESELDVILARFRNLKHLILDGCATLRAELRQGQWGVLGKSCALVGVKRARDREKELKAWLKERWVEDNQTLGSDGGPAQVIVSPARLEPRRQRPGRRGLATATVSLRSRSPSGQASSLPDTNTPRPPLPKIRILPFVPRLETLATTTVLETESSRHPGIRAEFEAGWAEGIAQLAVTRARLRTSSRNGVRLLRFAESAANPQSGRNHDMEGLEDVDTDDDDAFAISRDIAPILCLAGPERCGDHVLDCGHSVAWGIWHGTLEDG